MRRSTAGAPPGDPPSSSVDLQDVLWRLQRYGWILVLPIVACLCVATIIARRTVPIYQSFLVVSVDSPSDVSPAMRAYAPGNATVNAPRERIAIVDGMIHNQTFLRSIAERRGMDKDPVLIARARAATKVTPGITPEEHALRLAVGKLWTKISVGPGRGTAIQISVKDSNAEVARDLVATIGDALLQQALQSTLESVQARGEFSKDQVVVLEERLRQAENELRAFQESHLHMRITAGISSEAGLQLAQGLRRATEDEMAQLRLRILAGSEEWRSTSGNALMPSLSSARATDLGTQLVKIEESAALAQLTGKTAQTGEGDALQGRISATRQALFVEFDRLSQEVAGDASPGARNTAAGVALDRAVLRSLQARRNRLASAVSDFLSGVQRAPRDEIELQRLQDDVTSARNVLTTMRNESVSSGLSEAYATSQMGPRIQILEQPLLPLTPTSMGATATFAVAFILGLVIDAAIVFAGERLAAVVRTVEQAEAEYGLKVVGVVPRIDNRPKPGGYLSIHWPKFAILAVLLVSALVVVIDEVVSPRPTKSRQVEKERP